MELLVAILDAEQDLDGMVSSSLLRSSFGCTI
jgi:hypothetical protein